MPVSLALYQPDIPQNTGTIIRLAACLDFNLHIIHPTGFAFTDKNLKRAGMDYTDQAHITQHDSFAAFNAWRVAEGARLVLLTTKATQSIYQTQYADTDILLMGRESAGVPDTVAASTDAQIRIPMQKTLRSINVAMAAAMVMGEAKRQTDGFARLV